MFFDSLRIENSNLVDEIDCLVASQYDVQHESSVKLDKILSFQKFHGDKCGVDFEKEVSTSQNPPNSQGMIVLVPPIIAKESSPSLSSRKLEKGKGILGLV